MKNSELRGFASVFKFTLGQTFKQKSYIISLVFMLLISMVSFPLFKLMNKEDKADAISSIEKIYYINETNFDELSFDKISEKYDYMRDITYVESKEDVDTVCKMLEDHVKADEKTDEHSVLIHASIDLEQGGYVFTTYYAPAGDVEESDVQTLSNNLSNWFTEYKLTVMDVDDSIIDDITTPVTTKIMEYDDYTTMDTVVVISENDYNVVYGILMIFYMVIVLTASMVANKIIEEKSNRIVEYLMTNVRPMALMLGKILAMLVAGVGEVVLILVAGFSSYKVSEMIWPSEGNAGSALSSFISTDAIKGLGFGNVILCILIMIIGVLMYSLIAGLFGASVSKMEDAQQGLKNFTLIVLVAFFAAMIAVNLMWNVGINAFVKVIMFLPITSVMVLPGIILIGEATIVEIIISIVLMIITTILLFYFIALIYESVIVMNGNIVSLKTMIQMAKDSSRKNKGGAIHEGK